MLRAALIAACLAAFCLLIGGPGGVERVSADSLEVPECVAISKSTPYRGYGYAHVVILRSSCDTTLHCQVSTDATPGATDVELAPGASESLTTRIGSPASTFEANVSCEEN